MIGILDAQGNIKHNYRLLLTGMLTPCDDGTDVKIKDALDYKDNVRITVCHDCIW